MRHTVTIAALASATAAVLMATLTACGSGSGGDGAEDAKDSPSASVSANPATAYLRAAHGIQFTGGQPTDAELTDLPPKWCAGLADGHSAAWLFSGGGGNLYPNGMGWGTVKKNANQLLVAGVRAYCPERLDAVTAELRASGEY